MNCNRFTLCVVAMFVYLFTYEFVLHGILLEDIYVATAHLWRTEAQMQEYFSWTLGLTLAMATIITWIFTCNYEGKGVKEGLRFGLYIGLFMGILQAGIYPYMPISLSLAGAWFVGSLIEGIGAGVLLALIYRKKCL